jgi:periplasmic protein TonB
MRSLLIGWDNATNLERAELSFASRNKTYGGYLNRMRYSRSILVALFIGLSILAAGGSIPFITTWVETHKPKKAVEKITVVAKLVDAPSMDDDQPPPPKLDVPPPPQAATIRFTPPVVTKDEEVNDEPPPIQDDLQNTNAGLKTQEGSNDVYDLPDDNPVGEVIEEKVDDKVYELFAIEQQPEPPGGMAEFMKKLNKSINYPAAAAEAGVTGKVFLKFVIENDGSISNITIVRDPGAGCGEEAVRALKSMPKWKAGKQNGNPVRVSYMLPVVFKLNE